MSKYTRGYTTEPTPIHTVGVADNKGARLMTEASQLPDQRAMANVKTLAGLAILAALTAAVAGVALLIANPDSGSTLESTLGLTAAVAGLSTAVFAVAALIYAQVKGLWHYAPRWARVAAWALLIAVVAIPIVRSITQTN